MLGVGVGFIAPILPLYARALGATQFTVGLMGTAFTIAFTMLAIPAGWLSDRFGRRKPFIFGLLCLGVVIYGMSMAGQASILIFLRGVQGVSSAFIIPVAYAIIGDKVNRGILGKAIGLFGMLHGGGMAFGSIIGELVSSQGFSCLFIASAVIVLAAAIIAFFTVHDTGKFYSNRKLVLPNLKVIFKNKSLFLSFYGGGFVAGFIEMCIVTLVPAYLSMLGFNRLDIRLVFFFMLNSTLISQILAGWLSDKFGRLQILLIMLLSAGIFSILFTFSSSFIEVSLTMFILGFSYSSVYPVALALISEIGKGALGSSMGVYSLMYGVGGSIGPALSGLLADRFTLQAPYILNGIIAFSAATLTLSILLQNTHLKR